MTGRRHDCPGEGCPTCEARIRDIEDERTRSSDPQYDAWAADAAAADMVFQEPE